VKQRFFWSYWGPEDIFILLELWSFFFFLLLCRRTIVRSRFCIHHTHGQQWPQGSIFFSSCIAQHIPRQGQSLGKLVWLSNDKSDTYPSFQL